MRWKIWQFLKGKKLVRLGAGLLAGWACLSLLLLVFWGYHLFDWRGGLPRVDVCYSQSLSPEGISTIAIGAEGASVEVASSYDIREIQMELYGPGYINQEIRWKQQGDILHIYLDKYPITANAYGDRYRDTLTMRILLPKKSYDAISINGQRLHAAFYRCKAKQLSAQVAYGSILLQQADLQKADLWSNTSQIAVNRSRIHYLNIENREGNTSLLANQLRYWRYDNRHGQLDVRTRHLKGIWELNSRYGDIHIGTKKWSNNLLLDLHSDFGTVQASSKKKPWKETIPEALTANGLHLLEGRGEHMVMATTKEGHITLDTVTFAE